MGLHFIDRVPVLKLVEVIPALTTATDTVTRARSFVAERLGKVVIQDPDRSGFLVNALLLPCLLAAVRTVESGPPGRRTSTAAWSWAAPTRSARCGCPA